MTALRFGFSDNGLVDPRKIYREGTANIIFFTSFKFFVQSFPIKSPFGLELQLGRRMVRRLYFGRISLLQRRG